MPSVELVAGVLDPPLDDMTMLENCDICFRELADEDSLIELTRFLNDAYATLARSGLRYTATWQDSEITRQRIAGGVCYIAREKQRLVGTVTYYPPGSRSEPAEYAGEGIAAFGQLAVKQSYRNKGIGGRLVELCEARARRDSAKQIMLDTAEPAKHLILWYERMGYRIVSTADWEMTNYRSVIMSKAL